MFSACRRASRCSRSYRSAIRLDPWDGARSSARHCARWRTSSDTAAPSSKGAPGSVHAEVVDAADRAAAARGGESVFARRQRRPRPDTVESPAVALRVDVDDVLAAYAPPARAPGVRPARAAPDLEVAVVLAGIEANQRHLVGRRREHEGRLPVLCAVFRLVAGNDRLGRAPRVPRAIRLNLDTRRDQLHFFAGDDV